MNQFWETIKHKYFLFFAGVKLGVPLWLLIIHDWSKFLPSELPHYQRYFFGDKGDPEGFAFAWLYHQNRHPHHPEFWITRHDRVPGKCVSIGECLPMPYKYVKEMVADWMSNEILHSGSWDMIVWLKKEFSKKRLHPQTRKRVCDLLVFQGYDMGWYWEELVE